MSITTETESDGVKEQVRLFMAPHKMRVDTAEVSSILLFQEQKILMVLHSEKTYTTMDMPKENALPSATDKELAPSVPPDSSASNTDSAPPTIKKTGRKETIGSFLCEEWKISYPDGSREEWWVSEQAPELAELANRMGTSPSLSDEVLAANPFKLGCSGMEIKHFPVRQISYDADGKLVSKTTLLAYDKQPVPASVFSPPKGYKRQDIPAGFGAADIEKLDQFREGLEKKMESLEDELNKIPPEP